MKKSLSILFAAIFAACGGRSSAPSAQGSESVEYFVFVGTYTAGASEGIYVYRLNPQTGGLRLARTIQDRNNPSFLTIDIPRRRLFVVREVDNYQGTDQGAVAAYRIDPESGSLSFINAQPSGGAHPCHVTVDALGRFVFVANYSSGTIAAFPVQEDGSLSPASTVIQHRGSGPNKSRQEGPHAHSVTLSPDGRFLLACDLGIDKVMVYQTDFSGNGLVAEPSRFAAAAPGAGPRHLTFDPSGQRIYVINELNSSITVYDYHAEDGSLTRIESVSTLPPDFSGANTCADIHITPDGRFLYGSNRGHDSLAAFAVDAASGKLTLLGHTPTGRTPRNFVIDPSGSYILVANQNSDSIIVMQIDRQTGKLTPLQTVSVPSPVCIQIVERFH
ncbi:MAG: lactonase family protein [candidate division KSB1 bacterium]|nr:lactonase family protein [candidate division KSB1 bacterium]